MQARHGREEKQLRDAFRQLAAETDRLRQQLAEAQKAGGRDEQLVSAQGALGEILGSSRSSDSQGDDLDSELLGLRGSSAADAAIKVSFGKCNTLGYHLSNS